MSYNEDYLASIENKLDHLAITVDNIEVTAVILITVCLATQILDGSESSNKTREESELLPPAGECREEAGGSPAAADSPQVGVGRDQLRDGSAGLSDARELRGVRPRHQARLSHLRRPGSPQRLSDPGL